jgi:hypothetical protein
MNKLLAPAATVLCMLSSANAGAFTYMCQVGKNSYPVTVTTPYEKQGGLGGGTITWHGTTYPNVSATQEECKAQFKANRNGVFVELCTATQGYATLTVTRGGVGTDGADEYDCQMPGRKQ